MVRLKTNQRWNNKRNMTTRIQAQCVRNHFVSGRKPLFSPFRVWGLGCRFRTSYTQ